MSDQKILYLQKETGCDLSLAKVLLKFTGGDIDGATNILKSVDKNIYIFRIKFIAQTNKIYGTMLFFINTKNKLIDKFFCICKTDDKSVIEFDFDKKWDMTQEEMINYLKQNLIDVELQSKITTTINSTKILLFLENKLHNKKDIDENGIKNFFADILTNITGDVSLAIKLKIDKSDVFEVNKGDPKDFDIDFDNETSKKAETKKEKEQDQILQLKVEMDLAPVDGVQISDLEIGDLIGVKIIDDRPIAEYICQLLNAKDPVTNENITLFAELKDIKVTENGIAIKIEFGPGIYGIGYYGQDVKIRVADKASLFEEEKKIDTNKNNFFFKFFWLIGGALVAIIVIILVILLNNS